MLRRLTWWVAHPRLFAFVVVLVRLVASLWKERARNAGRAKVMRWVVIWWQRTMRKCPVLLGFWRCAG